MRVLLAPDSFKGSATASQVAQCLRAGWLEVRPEDDIVCLPMADGGEGTVEAIGAAVPDALVQHAVVDAPNGRAAVPWLLLPDGTAVVELAAACGLPMWRAPDPLGASTHALGQVLAAAAGDRRVGALVVALGGSASTDGGAGALAALGARLLDADGHRVGPGGEPLQRLDRVDLSTVVAPPAGGVVVLADVDAPLLGEDGAAAVFGPQKGATPGDIRLLDAGLARLAGVLGGDPAAPGAGAAGGTAYGLVVGWGARVRWGSVTNGELVGLDAALARSDLVVTGEGRLDAQSTRGKVVGHVISSARSAGVDVWACVGRVDPEAAAGLGVVTQLQDLAGSPGAAMAEPLGWLREAGRCLAASAGGGVPGPPEPGTGRHGVAGPRAAPRRGARDA